MELSPWQQEFERTIADVYEGEVSHFYLDTQGLVTIGKGCQIGMNEAVTLPMRLRDRAATPDEIKADYQRVGAMPLGKLAKFYASVNSPILPPEGIEALTAKRINSATQALKSMFPQFEVWPTPAKIATCEMVWGMGDYKFRVQYLKLRAALRDGDFREAAAECLWRDPQGIYVARNAHRVSLYLQAAKEQA